MDERKYPAEYSPEKHQENSEYDHKYVVDGLLDVPVHLSQQVIELWEGLGVLVLTETFLELQLERMKSTKMNIMAP